MFDRFVAGILVIAVAGVAWGLVAVNHELDQTQKLIQQTSQQAQQHNGRRFERRQREDMQRQIDNYQAHQEQIQCLATNLYFEARGEPRQGQLAVALVTINRVNSRRYPDSVCEVVHQARRDRHGNPIRNQCQFSWYCDGRREDIRDQRSYRQLRSVAEYVYINHLLNPGAMQDVTNGSTHYHADRVSPFWSDHPNYLEVAQIGQHIFYRPTY